MSKSRFTNLLRHAAFAALLGLTAGTIASVVHAQSAARLFATLSANLAGGVSTPVTCTASGSGCFLDVAIAGGSPTFTGQILAADGTVSLPSYSFTSDPDTGMFSVGANQGGFAAGGGESFGWGVGSVRLPAATVIGWTSAGINGSTDTTFGRVAAGKVVLIGTTPMLLLGGSTASFSAIKRNGVNAEARLADDSAYTGFAASIFSSGTTSTLTITTNTIAPTNAVHHLGAGLVKTITVPATCTPTCSIDIVPDAAFTTDATGNISVASTAVINRTLRFTWDGTKWNPSY